MYCAVEDMPTGDMEPVRPFTRQSFVDSAALEMDARLGQRYKVPIVLNPDRPSASGDIGLLKLINANLAAGRMILSSAAGGEDSTLHQYGVYLVDLADKWLTRLESGNVSLDEADELPDKKNAGAKGILVKNQDAYSLVDDYYQSPIPQAMPGSNVLWPAYGGYYGGYYYGQNPR